MTYHYALAHALASPSSNRSHIAVPCLFRGSVSFVQSAHMAQAKHMQQLQSQLKSKLVILCAVLCCALLLYRTAVTQCAGIPMQRFRVLLWLRCHRNPEKFKEVIRSQEQIIGKLEEMLNQALNAGTCWQAWQWP